MTAFFKPLGWARKLHLDQIVTLFAYNGGLT